MFIPDRSAEKSSEDKLNRAPFAHKLADTIRDWKLEESIVIGLYGAWGCGKTSVLNFAVERLAETTKDWTLEKKPIFIWFNPWSFSEQEKLLQAFFQQIYAEIKKVDPKAGEDLKQTIKKFAQVLGALEPIPWVGQVFSAGQKFVDIFVSDKTIQDTKKEVADVFRKLNRRIVIIIDDVDRLNREEIRLLFQAIKINADFPNTVYLVAFDRSVVENALSNEQGVSGREYLEKIVQVGFNVPDPDPTLLNKMLFDELDRILNSVLSEPLDRERWLKLYHSGFNSFFQSARDIKRYVNSLEMNLGMVHVEVDTVDFIGIESLRVFMPEIYQGIAENKSLFIRQRELFGDNRQLPEIKKSLDALFEKSGQPELARKISLELFPSLRSIYGNMYYGNEWSANWRKQKRICHEDNFDSYFLLGTPKGTVAHGEANEVLAQTTDFNLLVQIFNQYNQENRFRKLLERILDRLEDINQEQILSLVQALLMFGNTSSDIHTGIFDFGSDFQIHFAARNLLLKLPEEFRYSWFVKYLENNPPIFTSAYQVLHDTPQAGKPRETWLFSEEQLERLKAICIRNIENRSKDDEFLKQKEFKFVMFCWKEWVPESPTRTSFIDQTISDKNKFLDFVGNFIFIQRSQTAGSYLVETDQKFNSKEFFEFVDMIKAKKFIKDLTEDEVKSFSLERLTALRLLNEFLIYSEKKEKPEE